MISCKVKSVDHLKSAYGPGAAGAQGTCEQVTRSVVEQARVRAGAAAPVVRVDPEEQVWTGSSYLSPFELLSKDASDTLHVHTRYMRIDWDDCAGTSCRTGCVATCIATWFTRYWHGCSGAKPRNWSP